jgi:hypothetical protein
VIEKQKEIRVMTRRKLNEEPCKVVGCNHDHWISTNWFTVMVKTNGIEIVWAAPLVPALPRPANRQSTQLVDPVRWPAACYVAGDQEGVKSCSI